MRAGKRPHASACTYMEDEKSNIGMPCRNFVRAAPAGRLLCQQCHGTYVYGARRGEVFLAIGLGAIIGSAVYAEACGILDVTPIVAGLASSLMLGAVLATISVIRAFAGKVRTVRRRTFVH